LRFGDSSLQERVNQQSCERLQGYCSTLTDRLPHTAGIQSLPDLLSSLDRSVQTKKRKNVEVLWIAATSGSATPSQGACLAGPPEEGPRAPGAPGSRQAPSSSQTHRRPLGPPGDPPTSWCSGSSSAVILLAKYPDGTQSNAGNAGNATKHRVRFVST
ncbi:hypothetical protein PFLUV_G00169570, partial [Perca fluviatilis]